MTSIRVSQLRMLGRLADAEREARTGLAAEPQDADLLVELAAVLFDARRPVDGLVAADAAAALAPESDRVHHIRAMLLSRLGRHDEAMQAGYRSVSLAPETLYTALGYSAVLQQAGRLDDALTVAHRAVSLAPDAAAAHLRVADVASDRGTYRDRALARQAYAETLRLDPEHAGARHDLAVLDFSTSRPGRALRGLVEAGRMDPSIPVVLDNVVTVLWRLAWRTRIMLIVGTLVVLGVSGDGPRGADPWMVTGGARVSAACVLAALAAVVWWSFRDLPRSTAPVVRAALRSDRPLAVTYAALVLCLLIYVAVVTTGIGLLAIVAWQVLLLLAVLAVGAGLYRRFRARRRRRAGC